MAPEWDRYNLTPLINKDDPDLDRLYAEINAAAAQLGGTPIVRHKPLKLGVLGNGLISGKSYFAASVVLLGVAFIQRIPKTKDMAYIVSGNLLFGAFAFVFLNTLCLYRDHYRRETPHFKSIALCLTDIHNIAAIVVCGTLVVYALMVYDRP